MKVTIEVATPDADIVKQAIQKEIESSPYKKTKTCLHLKDTTLIIESETTDLRALRGTFNSYMNWLITVLDSLSLSV